jgi:aspartate aminotransferase
LEFNPENILIGPGSKELMFILQLAYYGDLIIPTPSWVSYAPQAHIIGRHVYWLKTIEENDWLLTPEELENHCKQDPSKPRLVILNYPNNPTGKSYTEEQLKQLANVARKYKLVLLSDEIYGELNHNGNHVSIAKYYPEGTIISGGLSKWCGAGGWRLGTFAFPKTLTWLLEGMAVIASETFTSTSAPIQYAAITAFKGGLKIERYLANSRKILKALGKYIYDKMSESNIRVTYPDGGFYFLPDFCYYKEKFAKKGIYTSRQLVNKALEDTSVAFLPGSVFGRPNDELTTRIAYVDFDGAKALAAAEQIGLESPIEEEFLRTHCSNVITATDKLCDWVKNL